jgi:hypothetical protein
MHILVNEVSTIEDRMTKAVMFDTTLKETVSGYIVNKPDGTLLDNRETVHEVV